MSDCDVCLIFDGDPAEVFTQENRKARKQYECCECERPILVGATYQICKMMYEGQWDTYRTCLVCAEIRKAFSCEGECIGGSFWEEMRDYGFPEISKSGDCLKKLTTPEAKRYFAERYRQWKELHA